MKRNKWMIGLAAALIAFGVLVLLNTLGLIPGSKTQIFFEIAFAIGGAGFLAAFAAGRTNWWAAILGCTSLGMAVVAAFPVGWAAGAFLGCISLSFWLIYAADRRQWWAIIPAGMLLTLVLFGIAASRFVSHEMAGATFFLGLAGTFALVYFLPTPERTDWAVWPAGAGLMLGIFISLPAGGALPWIWGAALIVGGGLLLVRALLPQRQ